MPQFVSIIRFRKSFHCPDFPSHDVAMTTDNTPARSGNPLVQGHNHRKCLASHKLRPLGSMSVTTAWNSWRLSRAIRFCSPRFRSIWRDSISSTCFHDFHRRARACPNLLATVCLRPSDESGDHTSPSGALPAKPEPHPDPLLSLVQKLQVKTLISSFKIVESGLSKSILSDVNGTWSIRVCCTKLEPLHSVIWMCGDYYCLVPVTSSASYISSGYLQTRAENL